MEGFHERAMSERVSERVSDGMGWDAGAVMVWALVLR